MIRKSNKITFHSDNVEVDILKPHPASRSVPDWYRKLEGATDGIMTVKKCVPFLDALSLGYHIPLTSDIAWEGTSNSFRHSSPVELVSRHFDSQIQGVALPPEFDPTPHKWTNHWFIKTPKGYSTLFIHPLNRMDLPFYSISGIVDTDSHPMIVHFPFVRRKDFIGTIPAGTPIIQAIPFKRSDWDSETIDELKSFYYEYTYQAQQPPFGWYKRNKWHRKIFR